MSVPLTVATESNAQMLVIFNKLYDSIIKNKLETGLNILKSKKDRFSFEWVELHQLLLRQSEIFLQRCICLYMYVHIFDYFFLITGLIPVYSISCDIMTSLITSNFDG